MADRKRFNESEPFDAVADATRRELADAFLRAFGNANRIHMADSQRMEALIIGMMTATCGCAASLFNENGHGEIRAYLVAVLPHCFDQALSIAGATPLGEAQ